MRLTSDEAADIVFELHEDWKKIDVEITDQGRWDLSKSGIFKQVSTGKFYNFDWREPGTEIQDCDPFTDEYYDPYEVEQTQVLVTQWIKKD